MLHHAILAYPEWPVWGEMVGIEDREFDYHVGERVLSQIADADHPITAGLGDWEMVDEVYEMKGAGAGSEGLIRCESAKSMATLAWTRRYGQSRVFCYQAGHDNEAWGNESFRRVLARGIAWAAGRR
jgi:type 1 glutamine amidotransferase